MRTSDALRRELEDDIEHGRLSPRDKLDEQTLAARFEVSRTPARGTIKRGDEVLAQNVMREHILLGGRMFADMIADLSHSESRKS